MANKPKVTIGIVLYKNEQYLKYCLESLLGQTYPYFEILLRDQSPNKEAGLYIKNNLPELYKKVSIDYGDNKWHSGGHNTLISKMSGEYYVCASNDMFYTKNFLSELIIELEKPENRNYGFATSKLMRWDFVKAENGNFNESKTNVIDSFGLSVSKSHQFKDIGHGEVDNGQYDTLKDIFGTSGALTVFRKRALDKIALKNKLGNYEYYDELLHYKNDVDLSYRLQSAGEKALIVQGSIVYHDRQANAFKKKGQFVKENSLYGQLIVIKKNFRKDYSLSIKISTYIALILRFLHTLIFNPSSLPQYKKIRSMKRIISDKSHQSINILKTKDLEKLFK